MSLRQAAAVDNSSNHFCLAVFPWVCHPASKLEAMTCLTLPDECRKCAKPVSSAITRHWCLAYCSSSPDAVVLSYQVRYAACIVLLAPSPGNRVIQQCMPCQMFHHKCIRSLLHMLVLLAEEPSPISGSNAMYATQPRNRLHQKHRRFSGFPFTSQRPFGGVHKKLGSPRSPIARATTLPTRCTALSCFICYHRDCYQMRQHCLCKERQALLANSLRTRCCVE